MKISANFNSFYHSILTEAYNKARSISFRQWKDTNTGTCLIFYKWEEYSTMDELKQIFKLMNIDLPTDGDIKLSTTKQDNKQLCDHILFITRILSENGIQWQHDIEEYERIKREAGII